MHGEFEYSPCLVSVELLVMAADYSAYNEVLNIISFVIIVQKHNYSFQKLHGKKTAENGKLRKSGLLSD